jgi:hypothetical protein
MEVCGQLHVPFVCMQGKSRFYPLDKRLGLGAMEKKSLYPSLEIDPQFLGRPARSLVTISTASLSLVS